MNLRVPPVVQREALRTMRRLIFRHDIEWVKQRARFRTATIAMRPLLGVRVSTTTVGGVSCTKLTPARVEGRRAVVYVHGGGYCIGSPAMGLALSSYVAVALHAEVVGVDYRLAPEHPAPAAVEDVAAVLHALRGHDVVALGDSAGAGALCSALQRGDSEVLAVALVSPWLDLSTDRSLDGELARRDPLLTPEWLDACARAYGVEHLERPEVSPLYGPWASFPPTLVISGGDDILAPDARRLAAMDLAQVQVREFPEFWHDFALSVGQLAIADEAALLIADHLGSGAGWRPSIPAI